MMVGYLVLQGDMEVVQEKTRINFQLGLLQIGFLALLLARMEQEVLLTPLVQQVNNPLITVLLVEQLAVWKL